MSASKPRILRVWFSHRLDLCSIPQQQNAELVKLWRTGQFQYLGIQCKATVDGVAGKFTLDSKGTWGVRGDHPTEINHVEFMEGEQMREMLDMVGCGERAIAHAFRKIERVKIEK